MINKIFGFIIIQLNFDKKHSKNIQFISKCLIFAVIINQNIYSMAQIAMTVRMDAQQKSMFDSLCEQFGMSANAAINVFVKAVIRTKSIPFAIKAKENKEDKVTAEARAAFERARANAENGITPELSLDEINAEIREVRRLRRERNGICCN